MANRQLFQIHYPVPGLPGEKVCAGCKAPEVMTEPAEGEAAGALAMDHADDCEQVSILTRGQR